MNILFLRNVIIASCAALMLFAPLCFAGTADYITVILPEKVIRQSIQSVLPFAINPQGDLVEGNLVLESIDRFTLSENSAEVHGLILGKNLVLNSRVGNQDFRLKIGEVRFPLTCTFTFRYDHKEKNLYITPHFADSVKKRPQEQVNKILPILALLNNREYPVPLSNLQAMQTKIGQRQLSVAMEPVDIQISGSQLVLKMVPKVSKIN